MLCIVHYKFNILTHLKLFVVVESGVWYRKLDRICPHCVKTAARGKLKRHIILQHPEKVKEALEEMPQLDIFIKFRNDGIL